MFSEGVNITVGSGKIIGSPAPLYTSYIKVSESGSKTFLGAYGLLPLQIIMLSSRPI